MGNNLGSALTSSLPAIAASCTADCSCQGFTWNGVTGQLKSQAAGALLMPDTTNLNQTCLGTYVRLEPCQTTSGGCSGSVLCGNGALLSLCSC